MFRKKTAERRTPASTQNTAVFSYHSSRSGADVSRGRYETPPGQNSVVERFKNVPTLLAILVIVGSILYASVLDTNPRVIVAASPTGKPLQRPTATYQNYIRQQLDQSLWSKNKLTLDSRALVTDLQKQFPEVANAIVTVPILGHRPVVRIAVSSPAFILASSQGAYYISETGVPLVKVSEVQNQLAAITTVNDETGLPIAVGTQVLPTDTVMFIRTLLDQMTATNTPVESVTLPLAASELQLRITGQPYAVRFNTAGDAKIQAGTFLAVKKRLEGSREIPKEYIDVRVEERAYYK